MSDGMDFDDTDYVSLFGQAGNLLGQNSHPIPTSGLAVSLALMEQAKQERIRNLLTLAEMTPPATGSAQRAAYDQAQHLLGVLPHVTG